MQDDEATKPMNFAEVGSLAKVDHPFDRPSLYDEDVDISDERQFEASLDIVHSSENLKAFCRLLCLLPGSRAATSIFYRSARRQLRWNKEGELVQYDIEELFIPPCIIMLFKEKDNVFMENEQLHMMTTRGLLQLVSVGEIEYISVSEQLRESLLSSKSSRDSNALLIERFGLLNTMLEAIPEEYSVIVWEEVQSQLRETIQLNCIPILRVINFDDIGRYIELLSGEKSDQTILARYLTLLLRCLRQLLGQYPFLQHLIMEILQRSTVDEDRPQYISEAVETKVLLEFQSEVWTSTNASSLLSEKVELASRFIVTRRLKGRLGIKIGEHILRKMIRDSSGTIRNSWNALKSEPPSSIEQIAFAYLTNTQPNFRDLREIETLTIKTLIAFVLSKRKFYEPAKNILESVVSPVESAYGRESWEYAITTAEFLKCCAVTGNTGIRRFDSLVPLANNAQSGPKEGNLFLKIALADALLADSGYEEAVEILESAQSAGLDNSSMIITVAIRLSKAQRRLGEVFPSPKITNALLKGLKWITQVSNPLRLAFIEEIQCNLNSVDLGHFPAYEILQESLAHYIARSHSAKSVQGSAQKEIKSAEELEADFKSVLSLATSLEVPAGMRTSISLFRDGTEPPVESVMTRQLSPPTLVQSQRALQESIRPSLLDRAQSDDPSQRAVSYSSYPSSDLRSPHSLLTNPRLSISTSQTSSSISAYIDNAIDIPYSLSEVWEREETSPTSSVSDLPLLPRSALAPNLISFLFVVNELPVNDDPAEGGVPARRNQTGRWVPPIYSNGFHPPAQGKIYRWANGTISDASECHWFGKAWVSRVMRPLTAYRTVTMFWCNPFVQFMAAKGDATMYDIATSAYPRNRWWPLTFRHDGAISRVDVGREPLLATEDSAWADSFGLVSHANHNVEDNIGKAGLAGDLALIIALIAFTCAADDLEDVLLKDQAWRHHVWRGHNRHHGRRDERGLMVDIFLDPENPQGSTVETLHDLEWNEKALVE